MIIAYSSFADFPPEEAGLQHMNPLLTYPESFLNLDLFSIFK
jgi:hypothetical protein